MGIIYEGFMKLNWLFEVKEIDCRIKLSNWFKWKFDINMNLEGGRIF